LNSRGHFFIPAMGATMLNVVMIASVLFLAPRMGKTLDTQIFALAIGVLVAGVAQAAFQLPVLRREGFEYNWVRPWNDDTVRTVVRQMIPGTIGVAALQINVLVTQGVAFLLDPQIVASFNYAVRLMELPQGVFGISMATFLLPTLSGLAAEKNWTDFRRTLDQGLAHILFVNLVISVMLVLLAAPIIRLLFERGEFTAASTQRAAVALAFLAPGLLAFSLVNIMARAFYALGDTKTPMQISVFCLGVNLALTLWLVIPLKQGGLGLANSLSAVCNAALLAFALRKKLGGLELDLFRRNLAPVAMATVVAGITAWCANRIWESRFGHGGLVLSAGSVFVPLCAAGAVYWVAALATGAPSAREMLDLIRRPGNRVK
jgi:putative peptidoglycan lipid II flippase